MSGLNKCLISPIDRSSALDDLVKIILSECAGTHILNADCGYIHCDRCPSSIKEEGKYHSGCIGNMTLSGEEINVRSLSEKNKEFILRVYLFGKMEVESDE